MSKRTAKRNCSGRSKVGPMYASDAALLQMTEQLRTHQGATHRLITDLGKAQFSAAKDVVAEYLHDPNGLIRSQALITLAIDFQLPEYEATAREFLANDADGDCKIAAITVLRYLRANTHDRATLALLAATVYGATLTETIRTSAYGTMHAIIQYDRTVRSKLFRQTLRIEDIDWAFVDQYLQNP